MATSAGTMKASRLSWDAIAEYAESVANYHSIYTPTGYADLDDLVMRLGGRVRIADSRESLHVNGPRDFTIYLSTVTSARRDRFTLAHELGHYVLHYLYEGESGPRSFNRGERNSLETQANVFASSLLMPRDEFTKAHRATGGDAWQLSERFGVSPKAAQVRAEVLKLA